MSAKMIATQERELRQLKPDVHERNWSRSGAHRVHGVPGGFTKAVSPKEFKEEVYGDVYGFGFPGYQHRIDQSTGEQIELGEDNDLIGGFAGVVSNDSYTTMTRICAQGHEANELVLKYFVQVFRLAREGKLLSFETESEHLVRE
jgi:hypothetical protein